MLLRELDDLFERDNISGQPILAAHHGGVDQPYGMLSYGINSPGSKWVACDGSLLTYNDKYHNLSAVLKNVNFSTTTLSASFNNLSNTIFAFNKFYLFGIDNSGNSAAISTSTSGNNFSNIYTTGSVFNINTINTNGN